MRELVVHSRGRAHPAGGVLRLHDHRMHTSNHLDVIAVKQAGILGRDQLKAVGWSSTAIDRAISRGTLLVLARGVYRTAGAPFTRNAAFHAAVAIGGPGATIARWSAAERHGIVAGRTGPIDVILPHRRRSLQGVAGLVRVTRSRHLPPGEKCEIDGLPVTSGARTLLDLAPACTTARLAELTAAALRLRACTTDELIAVLDGHPQARARRRLRVVIELLGDDGDGSRADVEVAALMAILGAGLPRPVVAYRVVEEDGRFVAEVDLAYPQWRIAIEIDGFAWHSSPARKRADEYRQNRLVVLGWAVLRFSATDVRNRPRHVVATIRAALETAGFPR